MAAKKPNYVVIHPKYNLMVGGKLQRLPVGKQIYLSAKAAGPKVKRGMIAPIGNDEALTVDESNEIQEQLEEAQKAADASKTV